VGSPRLTSTSRQAAPLSPGYCGLDQTDLATWICPARTLCSGPNPPLLFPGIGGAKRELIWLPAPFTFYVIWTTLRHSPTTLAICCLPQPCTGSYLSPSPSTNKPCVTSVCLCSLDRPPNSPHRIRLADYHDPGPEAAVRKARTWLKY
jgi:hypothetical protein